MVNIPEMNYLVTDEVEGVVHPRGEILMRGACVIPGYFKMPERTAEAI
jgi:long-chain acyl-CoA synthetase